MLVLCNLLSLHFGAESHQPGIRGVTEEMLLWALLIVDSSEQLGNVKKTQVSLEVCSSKIIIMGNKF